MSLWPGVRRDRMQAKSKIMNSSSPSTGLAQSSKIGSWNRFWFTPSDPILLSAMRIGIGLMAFYFVFSHSFDLIRWFGPHGILTAETVSKLSATYYDQVSYHFSYLNGIDAVSLLWIVHVLGMLIILALILGLATRVTAVLSAVVVLSYMHRAPMITGPFEPILTMMLIYLCLAPAGRCLSLDALWRKKKDAPDLTKNPDELSMSSMATIALRLMQVHLSAFYILMGLSKLAGETWWSGNAVWWLIARTESRLVDLTALHDATYLLNAWTHSIVAFELLFPVLIWNRQARPWLLWAAVAMWGSLALITGLVSFCAMMLVANLVFVPPETMRRFVESLLARLGLAKGETAAA